MVSDKANLCLKLNSLNSLLHRSSKIIFNKKNYNVILLIQHKVSIVSEETLNLKN